MMNEQKPDYDLINTSLEIRIIDLEARLARSKKGHDVCRKEHGRRCRELSKAVKTAQGFRRQLSDRDKRLSAIVKSMDSIDVRVTGWDCGEDIMTFNGSPIGATLPKGIDPHRWWGSLRETIKAHLKSAALGDTDKEVE